MVWPSLKLRRTGDARISCSGERIVNRAGKKFVVLSINQKDYVTIKSILLENVRIVEKTGVEKVRLENCSCGFANTSL